jgi:hypothetical protein
MTAISLDQALSLARSVLKIAGTYLVAKGIETASGMEDVSGLVLMIVGLWWSHANHAPDPPAAQPPPTITPTIHP